MVAYIEKIQDARRRDDGASAVEYGLLIAAVAALIVVVLFGFGNLVQGVFDSTCDTIATETQPPGDECATE